MILASRRGRDTDCARCMFQVKTLYTGIAWFSWPWPAACAAPGPPAAANRPAESSRDAAFNPGADNNVGNGVAAEYLSWCYRVKTVFPLVRPSTMARKTFFAFSIGKTCPIAGL